MARGSNGREGRAARSELPKMQVTNEPVSLDDTSVSERFFNEYREKSPQYPTKGRLNPSMSKDNLFKIGDALDEIKQKILPTKEIGLLDLSERERERYLSVRNDEKIGYTRSFNTDSNEKLQADFKELREKVQQKDGKDSPYDLADKIVVNQANDMLQAGYLGGKRDFALRASYFFDAMTKKYGEDVAARLTRASLREAYHRMQRSGMTFQEKDPRFSEQKETGRAAKSERPAKSAYRENAQEKIMEAMRKYEARTDLSRREKAEIFGQIYRGERDKEIFGD